MTITLQDKEVLNL